MIVHEYHEAGISEGLSEAPEAVLFHAPIAVSHGDGGILLPYCRGREQPTAQVVTALSLEFNVAWFDHETSLVKAPAR
jgi:hypothetical protein